MLVKYLTGGLWVTRRSNSALPSFTLYSIPIFKLWPLIIRNLIITWNSNPRSTVHGNTSRVRTKIWKCTQTHPYCRSRGCRCRQSWCGRTPSRACVWTAWVEHGLVRCPAHRGLTLRARLTCQHPRSLPPLPCTQ